MKTVSVSIDGLRDTHDVFRGLKGAYDKAMAGVDALLDEEEIAHVQITTVLHHSNVHELDQLYNIMSNVGIDSWRIVGVEPIGRARKNKELLLTGEDYRYLFDFIKEKRKENMPLIYGCSHFLGLDYECEMILNPYGKINLRFSEKIEFHKAENAKIVNHMIYVQVRRIIAGIIIAMNRWYVLKMFYFRTTPVYTFS